MTWFVAALVLYGAAFLVVMSFKDRWAWGWIEGRVRQVWPSGRITRRSLSVGPRGAVLEGLEARGRDRAGRTVNLTGGFVFCNWHEAVVSLKRLEMGDTVAEDVRAYAFFGKGRPAGVSAFVKQITFGKAGVTDVSLRGRVTKESGVLDALLCRLFGGEVRATGSILWGDRGGVSGDVTVIATQVDAGNVMKTLAPDAKFDLTGSYSGDLSLVFEKGVLKSVRGLLTSVSGGEMIVTDTSAFQGVNTTPGANLVVENLKDYHYDKGDIVLGLEGADIRLDIDLAGASGSRQLTVVFHGEENGQP